MTEERETAASGAVRAKLRGRYDLVSPHAEERLALTYEEGSLKYSDHNWRKGFPFSVLMNHVKHHITAYMKGGSGEDDLAHAAWGLFALMEQEATHPELDDRYTFLAPVTKGPIEESWMRYADEVWERQAQAPQSAVAESPVEHLPGCICLVPIIKCGFCVDGGCVGKFGRDLALVVETSNEHNKAHAENILHYHGELFSRVDTAETVSGPKGGLNVLYKEWSAT